MFKETEIWQQVSKFRSTSFTQRYLTQCYDKNNLKDSEKLAYQNCYSFIYYLEFGEKYFKQVNHSPLELQPILLFYGMVQLIKACILTKDPEYPATSQVLAHGVSTRKRKKAQYVFLDDEVKLQKNGLLTHFSEKLFHVKQFPGEKYKMRQLLRQLPELHSLFTDIENRKRLYTLHKKNPTEYHINKKILDDYQLGLSSFFQYLSLRGDIIDITEDKNNLLLKLKKPVSPLNPSPFLFNVNEQCFISPYRDESLGLPEMIIHYLLLYNLSMICRYETEWWGDLFHYNSEKDYPFIESFLTVTKEKVPFLLFYYLNKQLE